MRHLIEHLKIWPIQQAAKEEEIQEINVEFVSLSFHSELIRQVFKR